VASGDSGIAASQLVVIYEYVADIVERRGAHREAHLQWLSGWQADGRLLAAGVLGDPPNGALFILRADADAQAMIDGDPYIAAGLVLSARVEPWSVSVR
jgi:uncharacterized protein YciI